MFFLIRDNDTEEVLGILEHNYDYGDCLLESCSCFIKTLEIIVKDNTGIEKGYRWYYSWEEISQAEYETYRYLHKFRVFKCST